MRGRSSMSTRTIATSASVSTPLIARPNGLPVQNIRWITGSISGRRVHMSRAVTRWIVARINDARTALRLVSRSDSSTGSKPFRRVQRPMYGSIGTCACIPTSRSIASAAGSAARSSSSCLASVARLSSRIVSTFGDGDAIARDCHVYGRSRSARGRPHQIADGSLRSRDLSSIRSRRRATPGRLP